MDFLLYTILPTFLTTLSALMSIGHRPYWVDGLLIICSVLWWGKLIMKLREIRMRNRAATTLRALQLTDPKQDFIDEWNAYWDGLGKHPSD